VQRRHVQKVLRKNPSLRGRVEEALSEAYEDARDEAALETGLPLRGFPAALPYSWAEVMERPVLLDPEDA
jgi:hypothetical protein